MPIYEYKCQKCNEIYEVLILNSSDNPPTNCEHCGGNLVKIISKSDFHLKGAGWYKDGYSNQTSKSKNPPFSK